MNTDTVQYGRREAVQRLAAGTGRGESGVARLLAPETAALWERSPGATLFQHPALLHAWWRQFGGPAGGTAWTWQLDDADTGQPGLTAAWSIYRRSMWFSTALRRLQLVGQGTWIRDAFPAEYPSLVAAPMDGAALERAHRAALDATLEMDWDDLHFSWLVHDSPLDRALRSWAADRGLLHLAIGPEYTYAVPTAGSFDAYRASLGANARRALFGKWSAAEQRGIRFEPGAAADAPANFGVLCDLHDARWGGAGMAKGPREYLHHIVSQNLTGIEPRVSLLTCDGRPLSAGLNVTAKGAVYNLQTGFDPGFGSGLALGKLHHGREILRAFGDPEARSYDLLVGRGMKDDYKAMFATERKLVSTVWVIRSRLLRAALVGRRALGLLIGREYARAQAPGDATVAALAAARGRN